jgi:beta-lactamase class A
MTRQQLQSKLEKIAADLEGTMSLCVEVKGERFEIGHERKVSAASLIKVPVLMAAFHKAQTGLLDLNEIIPVPETERVGGSGVVSRMSRGVTLKLIDLLTLMIIVSDNTATNLAIDAVGLDYINDFLGTVGCKETVLGRRLMDYAARKAGRDNFTSAADMMVLYKELWEGSLLSPEYRQKAIEILSEQQYRDKLPRLLSEEPDVTFAHKTGELSDVEHDAGILFIRQQPAFIAALTTDLKMSAKGREAIGEVARAVWEYGREESQ